MKIHFIKEEMKETLKLNIKANLQNYNSSTCDWVKSCLDESAFVEYKNEIDTINFDLSSEKPTELDWKNSIILHKAMRNISRVDASDERLWVGLSHNECWNFMQYRHKRDANKLTEESVLNRYFFKDGNVQSRYRQTLSRMWWISESLYDETNVNPYWLLDFFKNDYGTKCYTIFGSNFTNNKEILIGLISAFIDLEKKGLKVEQKIFTDACRHLNVIGGSRVLDYYTKEEIYIIIFDRYKLLVNKK